MKKLILLLLVALSSVVNAQTFQTTGNWNDATKWASGNIGDAISENVTINSSRTATVAGTDNYTIGNLTVNNSSRITINAGGVLTIGANGTSKNINGASADNVRFDVSGKLEVWGNFTLKDNARLNVPSGGQLIVHGNFAMSGDFQGSVSGSVIVTGTTSFTDSNATLGGAGSWTTNGCTPSGSPFCSDGQILPVELVGFSATPTKESIQLNWATATELNFDYFSLQRSEDGQQFDEVAKIQGHGTTNQRQDYSYEDQAPISGRSYYRLTAVDFDKYEEIFEVVAVDFSGTRSVRIYPNPVVNGLINAELTFLPEEPVSFVISDLAGAVMARHQSKGRQSSFVVDLRQGTYFVQITTGDFSKVIAVVVQ